MIESGLAIPQIALGFPKKDVNSRIRAKTLMYALHSSAAIFHLDESTRLFIILKERMLEELWASAFGAPASARSLAASLESPASRQIKIGYQKSEGVIGGHLLRGHVLPNGIRVEAKRAKGMAKVNSRGDTVHAVIYKKGEHLAHQVRVPTPISARRLNKKRVEVAIHQLLAFRLHFKRLLKRPLRQGRAFALKQGYPKQCPCVSGGGVSSRLRLKASSLVAGAID